MSAPPMLGSALADVVVEPKGYRSTGKKLRFFGILTGLVTIAGALALPFAPVTVNDPTVSWPQHSSEPVSTLLSLEAGKPSSLTAEFTCRAVAAAAATDTLRAAHVLFATTDPDQPDQRQGLALTAEDGALVATLGTTILFRDPVPADSCRYRISTDAGQLVFSRDGHRLGESALPDVDALITAVTTLPGPDLAVTVGVDDRFSTVPSPVKVALMVIVALSAITAVTCLVISGRKRRKRARRRPGAADLLVGAALLGWLFLAPMTHDDGWMYAMARNYDHAGFVGNYYMYHNNSYVPFTWLLWVYSWWVKLGSAPVLLRVPSLVFALLTWAGVRGALGDLAKGRRLIVPALLFLAWWLPFDFGARQEASVAACLTVTVGALLAAHRRQRPVYLGLAVGAASLGLIAHTAGTLVVLPLLLSIPSAARLIRRNSESVSEAVGTVLGILSCAAISAFAGFADGSFNDFLRGSASFGGSGEVVADPVKDELSRYRDLLGDTALGNYALRTPVLLLLMVIPVFVVVCVLARRRRRPLPRTVWLTGWTCVLGLGLLVVTPSKWTWHFGAFSGVAAIFLGGFALALPALVKRLAPDRRVVFAAGMLLLAATGGWVWLAGQGRNWWADTSMPGVPGTGEPLLAGPTPLVAVGIALAGGYLVTRRRGGQFAPGSAAGLLVGCFLVGELVFLVGGFAVATVRTWDTWSPWADAVSDPLGRNCGEGRVLRVADPDTARPLEVLSGAVQTDGFAVDVWWPGSPPAAGPATATVYGNESGSPARMTTPWLRLPADLSPQHQLVTTMSGQIGGANRIDAEFAVSTPDGLKVAGSKEYAVPEDDVGWRDVAITDGGNLPAGMVAVRLTATATQNWFAFALPTERDLVPVADFLPRDGRALIDWQVDWLYPCMGQPAITNGISGAVSYTLGYGFGPVGSEYDIRNGGTWAAGMGGLLGSQVRASTVTRMYTVLSTDPGYPLRTVYRLTRPYADNAYDLHLGHQTLGGWKTPS
ncbi:MAG: hypothetical protein JWQ81_3579 [Amycolatopsis sp.]|uniref:arabinosyltransferase domain-containing protein n=1 Tax=Amycolatopsis sp. TaxID=37632 RepID=UPI002629975E|nr:arabinosyltransferase domain-containing protein [Amycolatopsis sp.]MCU1682840.1 hypothetical protein [Amycolatopsis sp.]